jgi:hypothetical protein
LSAAEDRFTQIETDENGSIHNGIRFMEEEEEEAEAIMLSGTSARTQEEYDEEEEAAYQNRENDDDDYNESPENNVNEQSIGPETGDATGEPGWFS